MSLKTLSARIDYLGGDQLSRINKQKLQSFRAALKNDYNSRLIKTDKHDSVPCIIKNNAYGLKADYDKKYISVEFSAGLEAGDVFQCLDDNSRWMIYLPILTETAYLRSEIIRCDHSLNINGKEYFVYFQGPVETDIRWFIKNGINANELNKSGTVYIKKDDNTLNFFHRFTKIKINGHMWEVQVTDPISVPGILELELQEYYDNKEADLPQVKPSDKNQLIKGEKIVKQNTSVGYMVDDSIYNLSTSWTIAGNDRVKIEEVLNNGQICKVKVNEGAIGKFTLSYGTNSMEITIDTSDSFINGPIEVFPYSTNRYSIVLPQGKEALFRTDNPNAKVVAVGDDYCDVEIVSGKSGKFKVMVKIDETIYELPVKIKSL
nr:MAG TPA: hypothetical protein [Caudoviricetes sp.]